MTINKLHTFAFHRVSEEFSPAYPPMPPKTFERIVKFLNRNYLVIPQEELTENTKFKSKKKLCVVTFDDAYYDFAQYALPILEKHKTPAALHIISNVAQNASTFWTQRLNKIIESYFLDNQVIAIGGGIE